MFQSLGGRKGEGKKEIKVHSFYLPLVCLVHGWLKPLQPGTAGQ